ncbi:Troponin T, putative [Brugia malayi]|uniref:Bm10785 n=3 Tax=Brugia TaxID=6278 RepID=A0A0J9Y199_BRUMA|nr:Troponin T, putative [Brugia malayi]CDP99634.1 Bm10785 [Brugia malayi]VIO91889.1 Troponin T, putative [Brugia malayi]
MTTVEKTIDLRNKDDDDDDDNGDGEEEEVEVETEDEDEDDNESEEAEDESENEQSEAFKKVESEMIKVDKECEGMTEATKAVLAAKKRQEEEYRLQYEVRRKEERERVEQELRSLREKQERRRREREQEEKELAEKMRLAEEKHRQEEEESKARMEAQKRKREEERCKKQAMLAGSLAGIVSSGNNCNPNFVIQKPEKTERNKNDKAREEKEEAKRAYMATVNQKPDVSHLLINDLKIKIHELHSRICKLEALKYDLEKRHERQLYDLKELHEREKQVARHRALQRGLDPNEAAASPHPPKINVASKFDRQFDRRSYGDRRIIFEKPPVEKALPIVHGTARPPPEWGRTENEELEQLRKIIEPRKYVEEIKVTNVRPPIDPIPLSLPQID